MTPLTRDRPSQASPVFLSYAAPDTKFVSRLASDLQAAGVSVLTNREVIGSVNRGSASVDALDQACAVILVLSSSSAKSRHVEDELRQFVGAPIIPVVLEDVEWGLLWWAKANRPIAFHRTPYAGAFQTLLAALPDAARTSSAVEDQPPRLAKQQFEPPPPQALAAQTAGRRVEVTVLLGDFTHLNADVIALKYARGLTGVAQLVADALGETQEDIGKRLRSSGGRFLLPGQGRIGATQVLFVDVGPLYAFGLNQIRQFLHDVLRDLRLKAPTTHHLGVTLHGVTFGIKPAQSLEAELQGITDALQAGDYPPQLEKITIIDRHKAHVEVLQATLSKMLPDHTIEAAPLADVQPPAPTPAGPIPGPRFDVFISYKSDDATYAQQVSEFLRSQRLLVFFSRESLPQLGSDEYHQQIDQAIETTRHMIVVTSSGAHAMAKWVQYEWRLFLGEKLAGRKPGNLMCVIAGDMRIDDLPISLRNREVVRLLPEELPRLLQYTKGASQSADRQDPSSSAGSDSHPQDFVAQPKPVEASEVITISNFVLARTEVLRDVSWLAAADRAASLSIAGQQGWRLPSIEELQLIKRAAVVPMEYCYWSGKEAPNNEAFYLHFDDGRVGRGPKGFSKGVGAVFVKPRR